MEEMKKEQEYYVAQMMQLTREIKKEREYQEKKQNNVLEQYMELMKKGLLALAQKGKSSV